MLICVCVRCVFLAPTPVLREICKRYGEYTKPFDIRVGVATYNVNGGKHFRSVVYKDLSLTDWLLDCHKMARSRCEYTKKSSEFAICICFSKYVLNFSFG